MISYQSLSEWKQTSRAKTLIIDQKMLVKAVSGGTALPPLSDITAARREGGFPGRQGRLMVGSEGEGWGSNGRARRALMERMT